MNLSYGKNIISIAYANVSFNTVMDETSRFKQTLFKAYMRKEKVSSFAYKHYIDVLKDFVDSWSKVATEIENSIKSAEGNASSSVPYSYIKDYIYGSYDYASILPYVDGLMAGFTDGNFKDEKDSANFENHVKDSAFRNRLNTTGGLLEDVVLITKAIREADKSEQSMFNALKGQRIFNYRDADDINDAVKKTVEYLCTSEEAASKLDGLFETRPKHAIIIINSACDFIAYTVLAYATRVLAIYSYAKPWVETTITEAVESKDEPAEPKPVVVIDELICRDHLKYRQMIEKFQTMCKELGVDEKDFKADWDIDDRTDDSQTTEFKGIVVGTNYHDPLIKNALYQCIVEDPIFKSGWFKWDGITREPIAWFRDKIDTLIVNGQQANIGIVSPKQDFISIIRVTGNDINTKADYIKLAAETVNVFSFLIWKIRTVLNDAQQKLNDDDYNGNYTYDLKIRLALAETVKILRELYCEIATAVFHKLEDIRLHIDEEDDKEFNDIMAKIEIKVPGGEKDDINHTDDMMSAVPDTTRCDMAEITEALDVYYMLPSYELLSLYDEYAHVVLGNDYYLEAAEDGFFNKVIAAIKAAIRKLASWINNNQRQSAIKWVSNHRAELESMTYSGKMSGIVDFKKDINIEFLKNIETAITNFDGKAVAKDFDKFKKSLYGTDNIYRLFYDATGNKLDFKEASEKFEKLVFTGNPNLENGLTLENDQIRDKMTNVWIPVMLSSNDSVNVYTKAADAVADAIKKLKDRLASTESITEAGENELKVEPAGDSTQSQQTGETKNDQQSTENKQDDTKKNDNDLKTKIRSELDVLATNVLVPFSTYVKDYYVAVYRYIQSAYTLGRK